MTAETRTRHTMVLSPHFDDAVFSCGATIRRLCAAGRRVLVFTVCASAPAGDLSSYAETLHRRWGAAPGTEQATARAMVATRRAEDAAALAYLGATGHYLDLADCIYRVGPEGGWLYQSDAGLFQSIATADLALVNHLATTLATFGDIGPRTKILAPLAAGNHVDHQLVRQAAELAFRGPQWTLWYYEDYPYAEDDAALADALGEGASWRPYLVRLSHDDLDAKVTAASAYASQISSFWPDRASQGRALRQFAERRGQEHGPVERLWLCRKARLVDTPQVSIAPLEPLDTGRQKEGQR